jgi:hypothetical protein
MGWNGDTTLLMDLGDGAAQGPEWADTLFKEESEHMPLERGDLFANDYLHAELALDRHRLRRLGRVDAVVIGNRNHVESCLLRTSKHLCHAGCAIGGHRVDVQIGSSLYASHPLLCWAHD